MSTPVPRDVIIDLWPLYASGEASAATRELVGEALAADPELAELLARQQPLDLPAANSDGNGSDNDLRLSALARTRRLLAARSWTMAVAIFVTLCPLLLRFDSDRITFLVAGDPNLLVLALIAVPLAWGVHIWLRLRLRVTGL